jgi:alcohol dehydrogenase, propanol-preferring
VVCAGIHMSDIPGFPYRHPLGGADARSVANLTRRDGEEFLALAPKVPVRTSSALSLTDDFSGPPRPRGGPPAGAFGRAGRCGGGKLRERDHDPGTC